MLWRTDELVLLFVVFAWLLGVIELGFRLGRRKLARGDEREHSHVGALQGGVLGLLALLLGFTFAMAVARFDTRKALVLEEANAIGTTLLRTEFLEPPQRQEAVRLLKDYVGARLAFYDAAIDEQRLAAAYAASSRSGSELWELAVAATEQDNRSVPIGLLVESLNAMFDVNEKRRVALENHVPEAVIVLLVVVASVALCYVAYGCGLDERRRLILNASFALLVAVVLIIILDFDRPRRGLVKVSQEPLIRIQQSLDQRAP